ncbi:MAG: glutaredoxin 3 [Betaproteobacteria bacterium]|nr:glutaredoxin 3 [Betaproteobacteria bacterium]
MAKVLMYSTGVCPFCLMAERLLKSKGVTEIEKVRVDLDPARREEMMSRTGRRTVPQIYIGDRHVGGYDDLAALDHAGGLDPLLAA